MLCFDLKRMPKVEGVLPNPEKGLQKAVDTNNQLKVLASMTVNPQKTNEDLEDDDRLKYDDDTKLSWLPQQECC